MKNNIPRIVSLLDQKIEEEKEFAKSMDNSRDFAIQKAFTDGIITARDIILNNSKF